MADLVWQWDWRGNALANLRILVCTRTCNDVPFEFNRPIVLPPDPVSVENPRTEPFFADEGPPPPNIPVSQLVPDDD